MKSRLTTAREMAGLSIGQAAKRLDWPTQMIERYESEDEVTSACRRRLADLYGVSVAWLRGETVTLPESTRAVLRKVEHTDDRQRLTELLEATQGAPVKETTASIAQWQNETFGPATTDGQRVVNTRMRVLHAFEAVLNANLYAPRPNLSRAIRAAEELAELIEMLVEDDNDPSAPTETADIDIVLRGIDAAHGVERADQVDRKMAVNRARLWHTTGDWHGQHAKETK